jgi:iron complex outermembrane receptor protein
MNERNQMRRPVLPIELVFSWRGRVLGALFAVALPLAKAGDADTNAPILTNLTFDQLSEIKIVSASKRSETASEVPAAVRVVTSEDIAASGATSIPQALRLVPGLNVAQINGSDWAIGARGFQSQYANKLLVLMDGRSVYTPTFGGVFWDMQDYFLDDLDRIEVILGPGGAIWGANAMNGVINVISKSAKDTQGGLVYGGGGSNPQALGGGRYGWKVDDDIYARVYTKYILNNSMNTPGGGSAHDPSQSSQTGFRVDGDRHSRTTWTVQGDTQWGQGDQPLNLPSLTAPPSYSRPNNHGIDTYAANLMGSSTTTLSPDSAVHLKAYYDFAQRDWAISDTSTHTVDLEAQHTWTGWNRHKLDTGMGGRFVQIDSGNAWAEVPGSYDTQLISGFIQDEFTLIEDQLTLTTGIKVEYDNHSGVAPQPSVRLAWFPRPNQTVWAAWSMAIRKPSEMELAGQLDAAVYPPAFRTMGNDGVDPEQLSAYELGWRWEPTKRWSFDTSIFYYHYDDLISYGLQDPIQQTNPIPAVIIPSPTQNGVRGHAYGGEVAVQWRPVDRWHLRAAFSCLQIQLEAYKPDPINFVGDETTSPRRTASLSSSLAVTHDVDFDTALRFVDEVIYYNIPSYVELDVQLRWRIRRNVALALVGQNLLQPQHGEYTQSLIHQNAEVPRGVYAKVTVKF